MSNYSGDVPPGRWGDHDVEQLIGRLLQVGVLLAAAVVLIGGVMLLVQHGSRPVEFATFSTATATHAETSAPKANCGVPRPRSTVAPNHASTTASQAMQTVA